jgi:glycosyltransferase involved in cell wall biosynthesis
MEEKPTVSIIIPVYNTLGYLLNLMTSLKCQTFQDFDVTVVNDGSEDASESEYEAQVHNAYPLCNYRRIAHTGNPSKVRNLGMQSATGRFLVFPDSDVVLLPIFLERLLKDVVDEVDIVYCDWIVRYRDGYGNVTDEYHRTNEFSYSFLRQGNYMTACSLVRASKCLQWNEDIIGLEDWELWLRMTKRGSVGKRVPEYLFYHYDKPGSVGRSFIYAEQMRRVLQSGDAPLT